MAEGSNSSRSVWAIKVFKFLLVRVPILLVLVFCGFYVFFYFAQTKMIFQIREDVINKLID